MCSLAPPLCHPTRAFARELDPRAPACARTAAVALITTRASPLVRYQLPIDSLGFGFIVKAMEGADDVGDAPEDGAGRGGPPQKRRRSADSAGASGLSDRFPIQAAARRRRLGDLTLWGRAWQASTWTGCSWRRRGGTGARSGSSRRCPAR